MQIQNVQNIKYSRNIDNDKNNGENKNREGDTG